MDNPCDPISQQQRQDALETRYAEDGRHDPDHPLHCLYTGLAAGLEPGITPAG